MKRKIGIGLYVLAGVVFLTWIFILYMVACYPGVFGGSFGVPGPGVLIEFAISFPWITAVWVGIGILFTALIVFTGRFLRR